MSTLMKVLGVIAIVVIGVVIMVTVGGVYLARNIHVHVNESGTGDNKTVSIATPAGNITVHTSDRLDPEEVGIPIYPGATRSSEHGGADFQIDMGDMHKDYSVTGATYVTTDSMDKVESFYREKFPAWHQWENKGEWQLDTKADGHIRSIAIRHENDETRIGVASVGPPAAN